MWEAIGTTKNKKTIHGLLNLIVGESINKFSIFCIVFCRFTQCEIACFSSFIYTEQLNENYSVWIYINRLYVKSVHRNNWCAWTPKTDRFWFKAISIWVDMFLTDNHFYIRSTTCEPTALLLILSKISK